MPRENHFCWKSAEIRLSYNLGSIYAKWLALNDCETEGAPCEQSNIKFVAHKIG